jgi:shikimate kinase
MKENKIIFLGFSGSGKSSLGKIVAQHLGWKFIDLDIEIEKHIQISIAQFFSQYGENEFRNIEMKIFEQEIQTKQLIMAVGGGFVCFPNRMQMINQLANTMWLNVDFNICFSRILQDGMENRPKIKNRTEAKVLFQQRKYFYQQARYTIQLKGESIDEDINELIYFILKKMSLFDN